MYSLGFRVSQSRFRVFRHEGPFSHSVIHIPGTKLKSPIPLRP